MPSKTDFNVSPYYDDFAESKKFHRVMYRPAYAVQARELTTQQSITQNQIEKMGDHLFKHGAMVIPGQIEPDFHYNAVKLTSFNGTLANYNSNTLTGGTSGVIADVVNQLNWQPGASVKGTIVFSSRQGVAVPEQSVVLRPAGQVVYVVNGDMVEQRNIKIGINQNGVIEIISGLKENEIVALDGAGYLTDQTKVNITSP